MRNCILPISEKVKERMNGLAAYIAGFYVDNVPDELQYGMNVRITTKREMDDYYKHEKHTDKTYPHDYTISVDINVGGEDGLIMLPRIHFDNNRVITSLFDYESSVHQNKWSDDKEEGCNA